MTTEVYVSIVTWEPSLNTEALDKVAHPIQALLNELAQTLSCSSAPGLLLKESEVRLKGYSQMTWSEF